MACIRPLSFPASHLVFGLTSDKDVARMVSRYTGACLGLLAFATAVIAGTLARNPISVILSRAVFALFVFCIGGMVLGGLAQAVINEHYRRREAEVLKSHKAASAAASAQDGADQQQAGGSPDDVNAAA
jgi:MFS family permease